MNPDTSQDEAPPKGVVAERVSLEASAPAEMCAGCRRPLTRRGSHGECLRCLLGFAFAADDSLAIDATPGPDLAAARTLRYGIFEVAVAEDGFPVELGSGAMAVTYRATDTVLHHAVALKVIDRKVAEHPAARARFLREARAAAKLHHPNVASVSHYGEQDGECYYVMELVEGETLEARVRREGPLSTAVTLEVGVQVARALAAAEACGVVHRDLKPSNLMLTTQQGESGAVGTVFTVKVIDWGLAKAVTAESPLGADHTRGGFVGTPAFASPEQFVRAADSRIDTRSDIYSLGVTLWYLLCGRTPFVGRTLEEIHARQSQEPPVEQLAAARVSGRIIALLRSMLNPDPAARPQSARELLDALHRCQKAFPPGNPLVPHRASRRWLVGALGLLVLVAASAGSWEILHARSALPAADRSIAVLPFENLSSDKADTFFTVGVQDEIAADLARIAALKVIGSESTRSYPPGGRDLARIGRELGVAQLLEGSVRRAGGQVQVVIRLINVHDLAHPWDVRYDRRLADVFAVQSEITRAVAARLHAALAPKEKAVLDEPPTRDLAAYDLYLRARAGPTIFQSPGDARRGYASQIPLLEAAVARDPNFALAYCQLALAHDSVQYYGSAGTEEERMIDHRALAEIALAKARRLRPDAGEVHLAQAFHFFRTSHDNEQAQIEVDLARNTLPNNAEVEEMAGEIARNQNHWEEAIRCLEKAVALEPRENVNRFTLANTYRLMRRYDSSDRLLGQIIETLTPRDAVAYRLFRALGGLEQRADLAPLRAAIDSITPAEEPNGELKDEYGLILALCAHDPYAVSCILAATRQSRFLINHVAYPNAWFEALAARMRQDRAGEQAAFAAARVEVERAFQTDTTNGHMLSLLAMIDAGLGNKDDAVREGRRACELLPLEKASVGAPVVASHLAVVYAWTDQPDLACAVLEKWIDRPAGSSLPAQPTYGDLRLNPLWDPLRGNPRFAALTARLASSASR